MARRGEYLFRRPGRSAVWLVKFQYPPALRETMRLTMDKREIPPGPSVQIRLHTTDRLEAEIAAAPLIAKHKRLLLAHAARTQAPDSFASEVVRPREMEPGRYTGDDGAMTIVTANEITVIGPDGSMTTRPNRKVRDDYQIDAAKLPPPLRRTYESVERPKRATTDTDAEIVENYIKAKGKNSEDANQARRTLAVFKEVNGGKTIAASGKRDVEFLIERLLASGGKGNTPLSPATVKRAISGLKAAVNIELKEDDPRLSRNIFTTVTVDESGTGEAFRESYTDADIAKVSQHLNVFDVDERLMWLMHINTGIRPGGIYSINADGWEDCTDRQTGEKRRTRWMRIAKDKDQPRGRKKHGPRTLPIPQAILDAGVLPENITAPLFTRPKKSILQSLNNKLAEMGVNVGGKTLYCARHRAIQILKAETSSDMRKAIFGHARSDIEDEYGRTAYGHSFPMWKLKLVMDIIAM